MGVTSAVFQSYGTVPWCKEAVKRRFKQGEISFDSNFNSLVGSLSGHGT